MGTETQVVCDDGSQLYYEGSLPAFSMGSLDGGSHPVLNAASLDDSHAGISVGSLDVSQPTLNRISSSSGGAVGATSYDLTEDTQPHADAPSAGAPPEPARPVAGVATPQGRCYSKLATTCSTKDGQYAKLGVHPGPPQQCASGADQPSRTARTRVWRASVVAGPAVEPLPATATAFKSPSPASTTPAVGKPPSPATPTPAELPTATKKKWVTLVTPPSPVPTRAPAVAKPPSPAPPAPAGPPTATPTPAEPHTTRTQPTTPTTAEPAAKRQRCGAQVDQMKKIQTQCAWTTHTDIPTELVPYFKDMVNSWRRLNTEGAPTFYEVTFTMKAFRDENDSKPSLS